MGLLDRLTRGLARTAERLAQRFDDIVGRADAPERAGGALDVDTVDALEPLAVPARMSEPSMPSSISRTKCSATSSGSQLK